MWNKAEAGVHGRLGSLGDAEPESDVNVLEGFEETCWAKFGLYGLAANERHRLLDERQRGWRVTRENSAY